MTGALGWFFAAAIVWWVSGADFVSLPLAAGVGAAGAVLAKGRWASVAGAWPWLGFLGLAVAAVAVAGRLGEPFAIRTLASYGAAGVVVWAAARAGAAGGGLRLARGVVIGGLTAHAVALAAAATGWPSGFWALASEVVPGGLLATEMGRQAFWKEAVPPLGFFSDEWRVRSIFMYENFYAMAGLVAAAAGWWLLREGGKSDRVLGRVAIALAPWAIWSAKSRSGLVALVCVGAWVWLGRGAGPAAWLRRVVAGAAAVGAAAWLMASGGEELGEVADFRRASTERRLDIYGQTARAVAARPWLGYGGPVDAGIARGEDEAGFDLGSHSEPLALAFGYGAPAALAALAAALLLLRAAARLGTVAGSAAAAALVAVLAQGLFIRLTLDGLPLAWALALAGAALGAARAGPADTGR